MADIRKLDYTEIEAYVSKLEKLSSEMVEQQDLLDGCLNVLNGTGVLEGKFTGSVMSNFEKCKSQISKMTTEINEFANVLKTQVSEATSQVESQIDSSFQDMPDIEF